MSLTTSGGMAGAVRLGLPPQVVDGAALTEAERCELTALVSAAAGEQPAPAGRARDAMSYTVTITEDGASTVLHRTDADLTEAFAALLDWLQEHTAPSL